MSLRIPSQPSSISFFQADAKSFFKSSWSSAYFFKCTAYFSSQRKLMGEAEVSIFNANGMRKGLTSYRTVASFADVYREVLTHIVFFQQQGKQQQEFLSDPFRQIRQQVSNHLPPNRRRIR